VVALPDQTPDPHGTLAWINAVFETLKQAYAALLIPTAAGVAWLVRRRDARRDDALKREDARRESEEAAHQRIADQLDRESAERFEAMRAENVRLRAENTRLIGLRQQWFDKAHAVRHEAGRVLSLAFMLLERAGVERPKLDLPALSYDLDVP